MKMERIEMRSKGTRTSTSKNLCLYYVFAGSEKRKKPGIDETNVEDSAKSPKEDEHQQIAKELLKNPTITFTPRYNDIHDSAMKGLVRRHNVSEKTVDLIDKFLAKSSSSKNAPTSGKVMLRRREIRVRSDDIFGTEEEEKKLKSRIDASVNLLQTSHIEKAFKIGMNLCSHEVRDTILQMTNELKQTREDMENRVNRINENSFLGMLRRRSS